MIHKAKDLSADQKLLIENLLGRHVLEDETISVRAFESSFVSDERRQEVADELARYFAEVDAHRLSSLPMRLPRSSLRPSKAPGQAIASTGEDRSRYDNSGSRN